MMTCAVCGGERLTLAYGTDGGIAITSLCEVIEGKTEARLCNDCGHVQSPEMPDIGSYYAQLYKVLTDSAEEDQIYRVEDGETIYRSDHQLNTLQEKLAIPEHAMILDFGCAKAATLRALCQRRPDIAPHVFDVSETYVPFWEQFVPSGNRAVFEPRKEWAGRFDVVTSFFSLEHVTDPRRTVSTIRTLLRDDGLLYFVVPNLFTNTADLVVIDHVHHFTRTSLETLLRREAMEIVSCDDQAHDGAWVIVAGKSDTQAADYLPPADELAKERLRVIEIAGFWKGMADRVRRWERDTPPSSKVAIYGAGFYGRFIAANLADPDRVCCFLDRNPFLTGKPVFSKPVYEPEHMDEDTKAIYLGVNPRIAGEVERYVKEIAPAGCRVFHA
jgi:SAM-dependent methyltransferase